MADWTVEYDGERHDLRTDETALTLGDRVIGWEQVSEVRFPTGFEVTVVLRDTTLLGLKFNSGSEQRSFRAVLEPLLSGTAVTVEQPYGTSRSDRRCPRGHSVKDPSAVRCPAPSCGELVDAGPSARRQREGSAAPASPTAGLLLVLGSFPLTVAGGLLLAGGSDDSAAIGLTLLASMLLFVGSAMFLVGCIAEGVRLGSKV